MARTWGRGRAGALWIPEIAGTGTFFYIFFPRKAVLSQGAPHPAAATLRGAVWGRILGGSCAPKPQCSPHTHANKQKQGAKGTKPQISSLPLGRDRTLGPDPSPPLIPSPVGQQEAASPARSVVKAEPRTAPLRWSRQEIWGQRPRPSQGCSQRRDNARVSSRRCGVRRGGRQPPPCSPRAPGIKQSPSPSPSPPEGWGPVGAPRT